MLKNSIEFPAISQQVNKGDYVVYYSHEAGETVPAVLGYLKEQQDRLIDLRVERPSLEDRFLEITQPDHINGAEL